jgi:hypothetical protein
MRDPSERLRDILDAIAKRLRAGFSTCNTRRVGSLHNQRLHRRAMRHKKGQRRRWAAPALRVKGACVGGERLQAGLEKALGEPTPRFADPHQCPLEHDLDFQVRPRERRHP